MPTRSETNAQATALLARFEARGATVVEPPILQPAETLLDLYGEDIRARAYVTSDALLGEQMLRPDFTVPVVQMHMAGAPSPARYTYAGEVFRRQDDTPGRPNEYVQVGYEIFDWSSPAEADADVFGLFSELLADLPVRAVTGDIGILMSAVTGLTTSDARKVALMRHIWRPHRFRTLLDRFAGRSSVTEKRRAPHPMDAPLIGLRTQSEIADRVAAQKADAETDPIPVQEVEAVDALLALKGSITAALSALQKLADTLPSTRHVSEGFARRTDALSSRGVDVEALAFEASFGRTSMEYYDGFVFEFHAASHADLPPIATGGRYDALTRQLGQGREIPAVGGVMRPGLLLEMEQAT